MKKLLRITTVKIKENDLDRLFTIVSQLYIFKNNLVLLSKRETLDSASLSKILINFEHVITSIYNEALRLKLIPLNVIFRRIEKTIYQLAKKLGKRIRAVIEGGDIYLDRKSIEALIDPLVHLVRNAVDHGIEFPEERKRKGKPEIGIIRIHAKREGFMISIIVEDDGRGIDIEKVKKKAVEKKIITPDQAKKLSWNDVINILATPGFSTSSKVTDVSGRGIGMDIVKRNVESLGGTVSIASEKNKGTKVILRIPLSSAIIKALIVKANTTYYIIPLLTVYHVQKISSMKMIEKREIVYLNGEIVTISHILKPNRPKYLVIISSPGGKVGLLVDEIFDKGSMMIEPLPRVLRKILPKYISGVSLVNDKKIAFLIDNHEIR